MSVVLSSITGQTKSATVTLGDAEVEFTYKPYAVTLGMSMALADEDADEEVIDLLADVLVSWDVVEVEGEPFPPSVENLKKVPTELATLIATEIVTGGDEVGEAGGSFGGG